VTTTARIGAHPDDIVSPVPRRLFGSFVEVDLSAWQSLELIEATCLTSDDVEATNTVDAPDRVVPVTLRGVTIDTGIVTADLPRVSLAVLRLRHRRQQ
jgi:alpha-L-arabinofuranosidase